MLFEERCDFFGIGILRQGSSRNIIFPNVAERGRGKNASYYITESTKAVLCQKAAKPQQLIIQTEQGILNGQNRFQRRRIFAAVGQFAHHGIPLARAVAERDSDNIAAVHKAL